MACVHFSIGVHRPLLQCDWIHRNDWKDAYKLDPRTSAEQLDASGDFVNPNVTIMDVLGP